MSQQRHVIKRQTVEITLAKKEDAWPIQQTLSRIFQQYFPAILDRCLSEISHPDCLHRIDLLELDLGELDANRLEADILESIEATLRQALLEFISPSQFPSTAKQQADPIQAHLELFDHFVREGSLPWWADSTQSRMPEKSFTALLNNDPRTLSRLLIKLIQEPRCLQRLISYFENDHLLAMMVLVTNVQEDLATSLLQTLLAAQATLHRLGGVPDLKLRATLWDSLLQVTVAGEPSASRHAEFLTAVTVRWARLQGISHKVLVSCIQQLSTSSPTINNPWLHAIKVTSHSLQVTTPDLRGFKNLAGLNPVTNEKIPIKPSARIDQRFAAFAVNAISKRYAVLKKQRTEQAKLLNELSSARQPADKLEEPVSYDNGVDLRRAKPSPNGEGVSIPKPTALISQEHQPASVIFSKRYAVLKKQYTEQAKLANELSSAIQPADKLEEPVSYDNGVDLRSAKPSPDGDGVRVTKSTALISQEHQPASVIFSKRYAVLKKQHTEQAKLANELSSARQPADKLEELISHDNGVDLRSAKPSPDGEEIRVPKPTALISQEHPPASVFFSKRYALLQQRLNVYPGQPPKPSREPLAGDISTALLPSQLAQKLVESRRFDRPSAKSNMSTDYQASMEPTDDKQTLSDTDALYINNAGLCILWPFLGSFFERLELVKDDHFHNLAAKQRAVSLLHYLATGELKPSEYWLPFNKLLCGMSIDEVFDCATSLTTTQIEACNDLLSAVINNAPILNNMSLNGFRGSFLLRQGVLGPGPGSWLLRVERETYDLVLDRFPWSWQWLKLPWMEYPLRVEW